ncbi:MAG: 50S ribosomal protein L15 [Candidatus Terrybacteria bacterium RIFCSPHIGHO2_01_FULL_48_17]|uniref:Large ribosomal subunit protein uL15 n=1 Tax=Candidatus Terrybacteria bacterium RIFCSPHIGHO2_01_FULL_48_17 TaxID=1802362 RepID=A0A1G2PMH2_9BACT|nr:MAG: 50S ribosomal protein L15 [Candidatus Terrybacteria bacterium RIFCSPHIGHO2_01_FULL_48_17]OHA52828.1 MAG: 50S ribosomal protein L15 [Candidatus Terrybacteria bacterium RIFCSPLOWO2_01_FULL_48_14]
MQLHHIKKPRNQKLSRRVGRGGKRGTYSGRGMKGQRSRAGAKIRPAVRDLIKKIPKLRGAEGRGTSPKKPLAPTIVLVERIQQHFRAGEKVTPRTLFAKGIVEKRLGKIPEVKLLGSGKISKKLLVSECQISSGARKAIEKAGGSIEKP